MVRGLLVLVLFIGLSSIVHAVGMVPLADVTANAGNEVTISLAMRGENVSRKYDFYMYAVPDTPYVKIDGVQKFSDTFTLDQYEIDTRSVEIVGTRDGEYKIVYGLKENAATSMFQAKIEDSFKFKVHGNYDPQTNTTSGGSSGGSSGGGAGGGGGYVPPAANSSLNHSGGKYVLVDGKLTFVPDKVIEANPPRYTEDGNVNVTAIVAAEQAAKQPPSAIAPVVDAAKNVVQTTTAAVIAVAPGAKKWGQLAIMAGLLMITLQLAVMTMVVKEEVS